MRPIARLAFAGFFVTVASTASMGCTSAVGGSSDDSAAAATTECKDVRTTPTQSQQTNDSGALVTTTVSIDASGCIASSAGSAKVVDELVALIQNDQKLAAVSGKHGKVFSKYTAHAPTGQIDDPGGQSRIIDVTFNASHSPSTSIKVTLKKSGGELAFSLTNIKGVGVMFFTAVDAGGLDVQLTAKPSASGVTISGTTKIVANAGYEDKLTDMNDLPSLVIHWLQDQIASG